MERDKRPGLDRLCGAAFVIQSMEIRIPPQALTQIPDCAIDFHHIGEERRVPSQDGTRREVLHEALDEYHALSLGSDQIGDNMP
jgi:hypothetical protein